MTRRFVASVVMGLLGTTAGTCQTADTPSANSDVINRIDQSMNTYAADGAGAALIVEANGEVILSKGYGLANRETGAPFTTQSIAQIGSITKQFTAAALLSLVHDGKVNLEAPIKTYLTAAPEPLASVTLHQLMTHSAGLPEYCGNDFTPITLDDMLNDCLSQPLLFEPGTRSKYSNPGFSVVAAVVEAVSGKKLEAFLTEEILQPNGLQHTGYFFPNPQNEVFAHGYVGDVDQGLISDRIAKLGDAWWNLKGNGGMQASADDMYRWHRALSGDGALPPETLELLRSPHSGWHDGVAEGYGWFFRDDGTGEPRLMAHGGSDGVFYAYYWDRLEDRVFFYLVGNSGENAVVKVIREVRAILTRAYVAPPKQQ